MEIVVKKDKVSLLKLAAKKLEKLLHTHKNTPTLFLSSGGSSLEILQYLENIPVNLSIGVIDERYSLDPQVNNFSQLQNTSFFKKNEARFAQILDTTVQHEESLEELAKRFEELLRNWKVANPEGIIIATLGIGPDGHISGINPSQDTDFEAKFVNTDMWVVGYKSNLTPPLRVTTTFPFLRQIDYAVSVITGENKKDALKRIKAEKGNLQETPGRVLSELKDVTILTDITL